MSAEYRLPSGHIVLIDDQDAPLVNGFQWSISSYGYAVRRMRVGLKQTQVLMHRMIMNASDGQVVDHINGNRLDNRRSNLRFATRTENLRNRHGVQKNNTSGFRGVYRNSSLKNPWRAMINFEGRFISLGSYPTKEDAARAYDEAVMQYHGDFASPNARDA